jgi:hypothetical protein
VAGAGVGAAAASDLPGPLPPLQVARLAGPITIDGKLDEAAWSAIEPIDQFWQQTPEEGRAPTEHTAVRLAYDRTNLYVGARLFDRQPGGIVGFVRERDIDAISQDDWFGFTIDPFRDRRNGFWFSTNPLGAQSDAQIFDEGRIFNTNWDGIWECRASRDALGWAVEMKIPFFNLRFERRQLYRMGINIFRTIKRKNETVFSPFLARAYRGSPSVSQARELIFEGPIEANRDWLFKPYVLGGFSRDAAAGEDTSADFKTGLDAKWAVTSGLTADFTLNTDFAQAEADDERINLTRFPLFFPEKRELFLEGAGFFDFGIPEETQVFFSRTIGLEQGLQVPLLGGARLQGRAGAYTLGLLEIQGRSKGEILATNFAVARVRRDLFSRSSIGAIFTSREAEGAGGGNRVGGADARLVFSDTMVLEGFAARSSNGGGAAGSASYLRFARAAREPWYLDLSYADLSTDFDPQVGFVRRPGVRKALAAASWKPRPNRPWARSLEVAGRLIGEYSQSGTLLSREQYGALAYELPSGDIFYASLQTNFERLQEVFHLAPGIDIRPGDYDNDELLLGFTSYDGRRLFGSFEWSRGDFFGGRLTRWVPAATFKFDDHLTLVGQLEINQIDRPPADPESQDTTLRLARLRARYALSTTLFASALVQWNGVTDELGINLRADWIHTPGADLFVVYDETLATELVPSIPRSKRRALLIKLTQVF